MSAGKAVFRPDLLSQFKKGKTLFFDTFRLKQLPLVLHGTLSKTQNNLRGGLFNEGAVGSVLITGATIA